MKNVTYDKAADAAYFSFKDTKVVDSETIFPGVILDYDDNDDVVGIERFAAVPTFNVRVR